MTAANRLPRFPIGAAVLVRGCHAGLTSGFHQCTEACVETDEPAVVVRHGRDGAGVYTRVRFDSNLREENWHRGGIRLNPVVISERVVREIEDIMVVMRASLRRAYPHLRDGREDEAHKALSDAAVHARYIVSALEGLDG